MRRVFIYTLIYNFLYLVLFPFILIYVFYGAIKNGKYRKGWKEKLTIEVPERVEGKVLWVHAVSVGETILIVPIVAKIKEIVGEKVKIYFSTTTYTGNKVAKERLASCVERVFYFPIDFYPFVYRLFSKLNPDVIMVVETEIWPSLLYEAARKKKRVYLVNGRISDRSFGRYLMLSFFFKPFLNFYKRAFVRSLSDKVRLMVLGMDEGRITVTGNLKYYSTLIQASNVRSAIVRDELMIDEKEKIVIFGSTHPGEEEIVVWVIKELVKRGYKVIVAPRHPERAMEVFNLIAGAELEVSLRSKGAFKGDVLVVDTIGELLKLYSISKFAVIGGTFVPVGGHNPLEPLCFSVPVIMGPYYNNFRDIVEYMKDFIYIVDSPLEILETVERLSDKPVDWTKLLERLSSIANNVNLVIQEIVEDLLEE
ncbi:MAG: 3-deoxy-D-manno-octulosonic acid transferase [Thermosulfidibacteraceae bacterium]|jgi:3-deoxy-D-manno-octulosonic-acid transferase